MIDYIKKYNFYTGEVYTNPNKVSVTEVAGNDILQMYLARMYGRKEENVIGQATLGSIFDLGMRSLIESINKSFNTSFESGVRMEKELPNGVIISGQPDIVDHKNKVIYDVKLTKLFALRFYEADPTEHQYTIQLNLYRWMISSDYRMRLIWALKDSSHENSNNIGESMVETEVAKIEDDGLVYFALRKTNLVRAIYNGQIEVPEKCEDTWRNNSRCFYYCSVNNFCKFYEKIREIPF